MCEFTNDSLPNVNVIVIFALRIATHSRRSTAAWQATPNETTYCRDRVRNIDTYAHGRRLLDVIDLSIFDFLLGNQDRHHFETFEAFGDRSPLVHYDHGRGLGRPYFDDNEILAPLLQCCSIRHSTLERLLSFQTGGDERSLSVLLRESTRGDLLAPLVSEANLRALDRRVTLVLRHVLQCKRRLENAGKPIESLIVNDGF